MSAVVPDEVAPGDDHADTDAAATAFEAMRRELALLHAAVEGFASRQQIIEARDYAPDLARIIEQQERNWEGLRTLASRPALALTPEAIGREIEAAGQTARRADHLAMEKAQSGLETSIASIDALTARARSAEAQLDALIWAVVLTMGLTAAMLTIVP